MAIVTGKEVIIKVGLRSSRRQGDQFSVVRQNRRRAFPVRFCRSLIYKSFYINEHEKQQKIIKHQNNLSKGNFLDQTENQTPSVSDLPQGLREIAKLPPSPQQQSQPSTKPKRPRTQKEQELDTLVQKRKQIIQQLKAKNQQATTCRKEIAQIKSLISVKGGSKTPRLIAEVERLEFAIATEAYTPKKEKEMIKKIKELNEQIAKNKEVDELRNKFHEQRRMLKEIVAEIKALEHELASVRKACDQKYAEVLAERKEAQERRKQEQQKRLEQLKQRVKEENERLRKKQLSKYMGNYEDTVTLDQIAIIEKKEKKPASKE
ncbi:MAG: hypothetical protein QXN37_02565 [Candidatus Anstonellaceae archaeon]